MATKCKLLIYSDCPSFGGCENMIVNLCNSDKIAEKFDITFLFRDHPEYREGMEKFTFSYCERFGLQVKVPGVRPTAGLFQKVRFAFKQLFYEWSNLRRFLSEFRAVDCDLLLVNNGGYPAAMSCLTACIAGSALKMPVALFVNNLAAERNRPDHWILDWLVGLSTSRFITASDAAGKRLHEMRGFPQDIMRAIPNTVVKGENSTDVTNLGAEKLMPQNGTMYFLSAGLLTERKGYHVLMDSIGIMRKKGVDLSNVRFVILGDGEERHALLNQRKELGLDEVVLLPGHQPSIHPFLQLADWFVIPSTRNEDFPYVVVEAMSRGLPIIGTRVAGIPEQIENEKNGFLIDPGDAASLADVLQNVIEEGESSAYGRESKQRFEELFSYSVFEEKFLAVLQEMEAARL